MDLGRSRGTAGPNIRSTHWLPEGLDSLARGRRPLPSDVSFPFSSLPLGRDRRRAIFVLRSLLQLPLRLEVGVLSGARRIWLPALRQRSQSSAGGRRLFFGTGPTVFFPRP